jgi:peptidoglycan/LPS O-acetylase OafA/YrhL
MVLSRAKTAPVLVTDAAIALGLALALASRPISALRIAEPIVRRGAAFSFSLYVLHLPIGVLIGAALEKLGWSKELMPPGPAAYSAFCLTAVGALGFTYLFARATEHKTAAFRRWLKRSLSWPEVTKPVAATHAS